MEIENESLSEELRETIIINSDNYPIIHNINLKTERNLCVCVDTKNDIRQHNQLHFANVMQALSKAEVIEMNVGMRFVEKESKDREGQGDWIYFIKGIGKSIKTLRISIGDYILNRSNLTQLGQELLRLNHLEIFYLQIGKERNFGVTGFTQLGESLRRMTQLKELSIIISDYCSLGANGAKRLFQGMEACAKIGKLKLHIGCYNRLNAEGTQIISAAVGQLKQVSDFDLFIAKTNDIGNEGMQLIDKNILQQHLSKSAEKLSLKIDDTKAIKVENIVQMFNSIGGFTKLKDLSVDLGVKKEMKEDSINIIRDSLKKLKSLLKIQMCINTDPCALIVTPMVDLLDQFSLSNKLVNLQFLIPPQNEFNNSALSLFAVNLKKLQQLQVFSLEIQENNLQGNIDLKRKEPAERGDNKNQKTNKKTTTKHRQEAIAKTRGISDISESLSSLKRLEKVEWIISTQNDVSDGGWERLSRSRSLREFRVKIGERCKLQDEGLRSLSQVSSSISLDCLRIEVNNENETSEGSWSNLLSSINLEKMKDFYISVGDFNECSEKSLGQLTAVFERNSPHIEYLTLEFKESNNINSESIQQLADSLKSMVYLKQFTFRMPQDLVINNSALNSLSSNLERMSELKDLRISFRIQNSVVLFDELKLCLTICTLKKLHLLNLHVSGNEYLVGNSIMKRTNSSKLPEYYFQNKQLLEFRTENGLQFIRQLKREQVSQEYIDKFAESLAQLVIAQKQVVYLLIQIDGMDTAEKSPQFTQLLSVLSGFKKCIKLKLNFQKQLLDEISLNSLDDSITCMPLLSKVSLKLDAQVLPLKAAETLAAFFENSPRITKVRLTCKSHPDQAQSQAQFLLMSSILTCPNLKQFQASFESYTQIKYAFKNQPTIEDFPLLSLMQENELPNTVDDNHQIVEEANENFSIQESSFQFTIKEGQEPPHDESLIHLGKFLKSTKNLQIIQLCVSSKKQISTKEAGLIQEGIMSQANLIHLHLGFVEKCIVTGEGAVLLSQSFANQQNNKKEQTMYIKTDDTFTADNALSALVSVLNDQSLDIRHNTMNITGSKFIVTTNLFFFKNKQILNLKNPKQIEQIALCQLNNLDESQSIRISQVADNLSQLKVKKNLYFDASECFQEGNQDWSSFRQLSFLTCVSIKDRSSNVSSRFLSLESALSHMTDLQSLTLALCHTRENVSTQETIIPFGKRLENLKYLTQFTITLEDFNFGEDGGQALGYGIEGMTALEQIKINCRNPQQLQTEAIIYLCDVISKSPKIQQFNLNFFGVHSSLEISWFSLLINLFWSKQLSSNTSSISVDGELHLATKQINFFLNLNYPVELNRGSIFYEIQLPSKNCFESAHEEAIKKCTDILKIYYDSSDETYSLENVSVAFDFTKPEQIEPNLLFLQTLFSVLQCQKRRIKTLKVSFSVIQNDQFQLIFDKSLRDFKFVDTLQLSLTNSFRFEFNFQELYSIASLNTIVTLRILIGMNYWNQRTLRKYILRKMKRLCTLNFD